MEEREFSKGGNRKYSPDYHRGVEGGYQLDHIKSIRECFRQNISVEECSHASNLQIITWEDNLKKRRLS